MYELSPLERVIAFLVLNAPQHLTITQVMKLVYLSDVEHVRAYGVPLCEIEWEWYYYGPFSQVVYSAVESLDQRHLVVDSGLQDGGRLILSNQEITESLVANLSPKILRTLTRIVQRFGHMSLGELKDVAYQSEPMLHSNSGDTLDLSRVPLNELSDALPELSLFIQMAPKPDTRSWGDPAASAEEDDAIMRAFSGLRRQSNTELE